MVYGIDCMINGKLNAERDLDCLYAEIDDVDLGSRL